MASTPNVMPLSPAASSLADTPSTMKLLERLRWLAIESPWPGTAEVSAKSCVLFVLVGDTPGTSSARSRKLRPFIGRFWTSACGTVPAIWLRAVSSTWAVGDDGDGGVDAGDLQGDRNIERRAGAQDQRACVVLEPLELRPQLVRANFQVRKTESSVGLGDGLGR